MESYIKESLQTLVAGKYDVIVCGGGPAGTAAAIAAARNGMKTLLVEQYSCLGGMWTAGLVNPFYDIDNKGGLVKELVDILKKRNAWGGWQNMCFDIETIKFTLDELVSNAGASIIFQTFVCGAIVEDGSVKGIVVQNKAGRQAYLAKVVIDCTGDGDVSKYAGAAFHIGRPNDGMMQAMTLMFKLGHVCFWQTPTNELITLIMKAMQENHVDLKLSYKRPCILMLPGESTAVVQMVHIRRISPFDAEAMSKAYLSARKEIREIVCFFRGYIPELKDVTLEQTAIQMGVRESRRIVGEYTLTFEDLMEGRKFKDGIALCAFPIDIHQPDRDDQENYFPKPYHIPYRCMLPKKIDNLLVAGRCISGSHEALASYRVTGDCMAMGEAAGVAASIAVQDHVKPRDVDTEKLVGFLTRRNSVKL